MFEIDPLNAESLVKSRVVNDDDDTWHGFFPLCTEKLKSEYRIKNENLYFLFYSEVRHKKESRDRGETRKEGGQKK